MKRTILLIIVAAWLLLPTGTPDDFISIALMRLLGQYYVLLVVVLLALMAYHKITFKKIGEGMKEVTKDVKRWFK